MIYVDKDMNINTYIDMYMCISPQRLSLSVLLNRVLLKSFFFFFPWYNCKNYFFSHFHVSLLQEKTSLSSKKKNTKYPKSDLYLKSHYLPKKFY